MKDLSITQEYLICTVNEKGALPSFNQNPAVCLILSGMLEMQLEKCIELKGKEVTVCADLPERMAYLKPLYDVINQGKPVKAEKIVETYTFSFTNKKLNELMEALVNSLKEADVVEPVKAGLLGNKDSYAPKKEVITCIIEKIRAELLEDGAVSEDVVTLAVLMDTAGKLKDYFSKFEQKELKHRIDEIKNSETGTLVKESVQHIEELVGAAAVSSIIASTV